MGHSVGDAAKRSVAKSQQGAKKEALTPERAVQEIRSLRAGNLQVMNMEYVDLLLASFDTNAAFLLDAETQVQNLKAALAQAEQWHNEFDKMVAIRDRFVAERDEFERVYKEVLAERDKLIEDNTRFREVYDTENRSVDLTVETVAAPSTEEGAL